MNVRVACSNPECGKSYSVSDGSLGKTATCKHCGQKFILAQSQDDTQRQSEGSDTGTSNGVDTSATLPQKLGRFEIRSRLGAGAFGAVYRGYDPTLDREVALKVAHPGSLDSEKAKARFLREPKAAAQLRHPNIVPVHDAGVEGDIYYIASAFIEGQTLKDAIEEERFDFQISVRIVRDLAEALHYAHGRGIVHRDVKPANVMLDPDGNPLLMDFGLARLAETESKLTQDGTVMGTAAYMPPEQASARHDLVGPASDQYSVGVMLYELLCGQTPFSGPPALVISMVINREPPSPQTIDARIPKDLETICLKAMAKDRQHRYPSCRELGDDLRRWQEGEPIRARRLNPVERAVRWARRNPLIAALVGAVVLVTIIGFTAVSWQWRRAVHAQQQAVESQQQAVESQQARTLAQVESLLRADIQQVPYILESLQPVWPDVEPNLNQRIKQADVPDSERLRLSLALAPQDESQVSYLRQKLLTAEPSEFLVIRDALVPYADQLKSDLWKTAFDAQAERTHRFRAACALAAFDADNRQREWASVSQDVAAVLAAQNPLVAGTWMEALRPVRSVLSPPLLKISGDAKRPEAERSLAATILCDYMADQPNILVGLLLDADQKQFAMVLPKLKTQVQKATELLECELLKQVPDEATEDERVRFASRQANAAAALLQLGVSQKAWDVFQHRPDPTARSYLIHRAAPLGVNPRVIMARLDGETDVSARRALILSLGEFGEDELGLAERGSLAPKLLAMYRDDPDPGIHGAAEWLLRQWQQGDLLRQIDGELATGRPEGDRQWYVNGQGQTMVIVEGPVEFVMGSPETEADHGINELQHRRRIRGSFAIAAKEVSVAQYERFLTENSGVARGESKYRNLLTENSGVARGESEYRDRYYPDADGPECSINWYEAAAYCNWLSKSEGMPQAQWCYEANTEGKFAEGMKPGANSLQRTGYRLPSEAEWEYACRAGSTTSRYFGSDELLLTSYAWYQDNSDRARPAASLKPNDLGLFDMLGNAFEKSHNRLLEYPSGGGVDSEDGVRVSDLRGRVQRGGSFYDYADVLRSASRYSDRPCDRAFFFGFRVARTYR